MAEVKAVQQPQGAHHGLGFLVLAEAEALGLFGLNVLHPLP